jgi:purine nucleosidase
VSRPFQGDTITPAAEFTICIAPEAADIVLKSGAPLVVMPLDVTHKALTSREWVEEMHTLGTPVGQAVASWTDVFERFDTAKDGSAGAPLHDPCVIAYLLEPALFTGRHINVRIETGSELTLGMTVADWWRVTGREPNAMVLGGVDRDGFYRLLTERLGRL